MEQTYKDQIGVDPTHVVSTVSSKMEQRKGQDTDIDVYEVRDATGEFVAEIEIRNSMSMYPPFTRHVSFLTLRGTGGSGSLRFEK